MGVVPLSDRGYVRTGVLSPELRASPSAAVHSISSSSTKLYLLFTFVWVNNIFYPIYNYVSCLASLWERSVYLGKILASIF